MSSARDDRAGTGSRKADTVDDLLEGFGPGRSDLPRVVRQEDTTPPPDPPAAKRELPSTEPGARQRLRNMLLALLLSFAVVVLAGLALLAASR